MRIIEHRRHTMRVKPDQHLSQAGVDLARTVGENLSPFDLVITSTLPRAYETAIAMGFAVDEQCEELAFLPVGFEDEVRWDEGFARFADVIRENSAGAVAQIAVRMAKLHRQIAAELPNSGRALLISHGCIVEASTVRCAPLVDYGSWGPAWD